MNTIMNKEVRNYDLELASGESRVVEGYALVFDTQSNDLGGFREMIDSRALDGVLEKSDILCLLNHNEDKGVLARNNKGKGSLALSVDEKGLKYRFEAPRTTVGDELIEGLKRGDINTSSFAFTVAEDDWTDMGGGIYLRTIKKFERLYDVSPVYRPAYDETSVQLGQRCLDKLQSLKEANKAELEKYYGDLEKKLK